jgi:hypothetical protein
MSGPILCAPLVFMTWMWSAPTTRVRSRSLARPWFQERAVPAAEVRTCSGINLDQIAIQVEHQRAGGCRRLRQEPGRVRCLWVEGRTSLGVGGSGRVVAGELIDNAEADVDVECTVPYHLRS